MSNLLDRIKTMFGQDPKTGPAKSGRTGSNRQDSPISESRSNAGAIPDGELLSPAEAKLLHKAFLGAALGLNLETLPPPDKQATTIIRQQMKVLATADGRRTTVPRLPAVVPMFLRSLRDPNASATDFVEIITRDPVLTTNVLRLVNSAFYNPAGREIDSIHRAVIVLGLDGLRFAVSSAVMHPILETGNSDFATFGPALWQHSQDCALICQLLAPQSGVSTFEAYLTGMVHEVGNVTLFNQLAGACRFAGVPAASCLVRAFQTHGTALCSDIVKDWQLPAAIAIAIEEQVSLPTVTSKLGMLLNRANNLAEAYFLRSRDAETPLPGGFFSSEEATHFFERVTGMREKIRSGSG